MKLSQIILEEYQDEQQFFLAFQGEIKECHKKYDAKQEQIEQESNDNAIIRLADERWAIGNHIKTCRLKIKEQVLTLTNLTQAYKDALYMEGEIRGNEEDRQVHLHDIMNDFMVRNTLSGSEAVELVGEHMKQFESMTLAKLNEIASKVEHPTKK